MKPRIKLYLPQSESLQMYIEGLLELKLVADIHIEHIDWAGANEDLFRISAEVAKRIHQDWDAIDGVMIWAPDVSALAISGYLSLVYPKPGIPIICFSAPQGGYSGALELGLKSLLVNATFLAASDLAEVLLLSGSKVMRPKQAIWNNHAGQLELRGSEKALAEVNYGLTEMQKYQARAKAKPVLQQPASMGERSFDFSQPSWWVDLVTGFAEELFEEKDRAVQFIRERL